MTFALLCATTALGGPLRSNEEQITMARYIRMDSYKLMEYCSNLYEEFVSTSVLDRPSLAVAFSYRARLSRNSRGARIRLKTLEMTASSKKVPPEHLVGAKKVLL